MKQYDCAMRTSRELSVSLDKHESAWPTAGSVIVPMPRPADSPLASPFTPGPLPRVDGEQLRNCIIADVMGDAGRIAAGLERVELDQKFLLWEAGEALQYVYFPETAVISYLTGCSQVGPIEVVTVGREGIAGLSAFLDTDSSPMRAIVKVRGIAERMSIASFRACLIAHPRLHGRLLRYTGSFMAQLAQTATCNALHCLEQRCARWLLVTHDRTDGDAIEVTHEFIASLLGVRRAGITTVMHSLKEQKLVSYTRGCVTITNRAGLERIVCACYHIMRSHEQGSQHTVRPVTEETHVERRPATDA